MLLQNKFIQYTCMRLCIVHFGWKPE